MSYEVPGIIGALSSRLAVAVKIVLEIVREVSQLGMEVCVTRGEIGPVEAVETANEGACVSHRAKARR